MYRSVYIIDCCTLMIICEIYILYLRDHFSLRIVHCLCDYVYTLQLLQYYFLNTCIEI